MKALTQTLLVVSVLLAGCASQTVYVKTLAEPKWAVGGMRTIGVVPVTVQKTSELARRTVDFAIILSQKLSNSVYYTAVKQQEFSAGSFETGPGGEHFLTEEETQKLAQALGVDCILAIDLLSADAWLSLGEVPYSFGFGAGGEHAFGYTEFYGRPFWYARARLVLSIDLRRGVDGKSVKYITQTHEFSRDFGQLMPSEEKVISMLMERACDWFIPHIDVSFVLYQRTFLQDGSKLVRDGVAYAMRQDKADLEAALQLLQDALKENPNSVAALYDSAVALELLERYPEAFQKYVEARMASGSPDSFEREIAQSKRSASVFENFVSKKEKGKAESQPQQQEKEAQPTQQAQPSQETKPPEQAPKEEKQQK
jgi:tetratricopeptide (TPR) repeat protein